MLQFGLKRVADYLQHQRLRNRKALQVAVALDSGSHLETEPDVAVLVKDGHSHMSLLVLHIECLFHLLKLGLGHRFIHKPNRVDVPAVKHSLLQADFLAAVFNLLRLQNEERDDIAREAEIHLLQHHFEYVVELGFLLHVLHKLL